MGKHLSLDELREAIDFGIANAESLNAQAWKNSKQRVNGLTLQQLYNRANQRQRRGVAFAGYGDWKTYLKKLHKVDAYDGELSERQLNELVNLGIQQTGLTSAKHWAENAKTRVNGKTLKQLYALLRARRRNGITFLGHGSWDSYLRREQRVTSIDQWKWSNERVHKTIVVLLKKYPHKEVSWPQQRRAVLHGKSLFDYYMLAYRRISRGKPFFGHGNWRAYAAYLETEYEAKPLTPIK